MAVWVDGWWLGLSSANTDAEGHYCFEVAPGTYTITPARSSAEVSKSVLLSPPQRTVTVADAPVLHAHFVQARVKVAGRVKCIGGSCAAANVKVVLLSRSDDQRMIASLSPQGTAHPCAPPLPYPCTAHLIGCVILWYVVAVAVAAAHRHVPLFGCVARLLQSQCAADRVVLGQAANRPQRMPCGCGCGCGCAEAELCVTEPERCLCCGCAAASRWSMWM